MIEIRDAGPKAWTVSGYATTWNQPYFVASPRDGTFMEQMRPGTFAAATSGREDVELLREHAPDSLSYASTARRTLKLVDDPTGLLMAGILPKSEPAARAVVDEVRSGYLRGLSVGFTKELDHWGKWTDGRTELRTVSLASLGEISMVQRPANKATTLDVRHETRSDVIEYRSVGLVYRDAVLPDVGGAYPYSGGIAPPNLRPGTGDQLCSSCEFFGDERCSLYSWPVEAGWTCDSWMADEDAEPDDDSDDAPEGRKRTLLAPNDTESLWEQMALRGVHRR